MRKLIAAAGRERVKIAVLVGVYLAAIVTANIITARYGPTASVYNAFALIGLDLITRDRLADFWGTSRWQRMALLIGAGSAISFLIAQDVQAIAEASAISFACCTTCCDAASGSSEPTQPRGSEPRSTASSFPRSRSAGSCGARRSASSQPRSRAPCCGPRSSRRSAQAG